MSVITQEYPDAASGGPEFDLVLNPDLYTEESEALMRQRGIIRDGESLKDAFDRVVGSLTELDEELNGIADPEFVSSVADLVGSGVVVFGTPVLTNAGRVEAVTAACTVLPVRVAEGSVDVGSFYSDSMAALDKAIGTGYDLSELTEPDVALVDLNQALDQINRELLKRQQRPVASMATLRADHPRVREFIRAKREVDFSQWRFNLSLFVTEGFFEAVAEGRSWDLRDNDGRVVDTIDARELLDEIADCAHYCGEPGILFKDRIDRDNPTPLWEYKSTAPCAEVAMAEGEACQFSYVNVEPLIGPDGTFDIERFSVAVRVTTRLLDASVEHTIRNSGALSLPLVEQKRRIGVGITGFADLLVRLNIPYNDPQAITLASQISELLDFHSKHASVQLARTRGAFPAYPVSRFLEPEWLRRKMPSATGVVPEAAWEDLFGAIETHGIRHASTTAMPPTGTSSTIIGSSKSLEPIFSLTDHNGQFSRVVRESLQRSEHAIVAAALGAASLGRNLSMLSSEMLAALPHLRTARQIDPSTHLSVQAAFQHFLDEALAKTINFGNHVGKGDVLAAFWSAYEQQLKGLTVFRDGCLAERAVARA